MAMRFKRRSNGPKVGYIIGGVITLVFTLWVGGVMLQNIGTSLGNFTAATNPMFTPLNFLGMSGTTTAPWSSTALVGILGLAAVGSFILGFFKFSFK